MRAREIITELFEPVPLDQLDADLNIQHLSQTDAQWQWQFQVADSQGTPKPFCLRAINLSRGYYMPNELDSAWAVNLIQADCSKTLLPNQETLAAMGNLGNMGTEQAIKVFATCGSLLKDFAQKSRAKAIVFNGVPERERLYNTFARLIEKQTGWPHVVKEGSFIMPQRFYFFTADKRLMKNMLNIFRSLGQID